MKYRSCFFAIVSSLLLAVLVVALAYGFENWRGARAWADARRELQAKGESLDFQRFIPPPVPDDQNLAFAPFYVRALAYRPDPKTGFYTFGPINARPEELRTMPFGASHPSFTATPGRAPTPRMDLESCARYFRQTDGFPHSGNPNAPAAEEVLIALTRYDPALDELAKAAAERPLTRFPVPWRTANPFMLALPHYEIEQKIVSTLALRASAHLVTGQSADALRDLSLACRMCRDIGAEPSLLAHVMQFTSLRILLNSVWAGLADRRWSPAELAQVQAELARLDLIAGYRFILRAERANFVTTGITYLSTHLGELPSIQLPGGSTSDPQEKFYRRIGYFAPHGWFDANRAVLARFMQTYYIEALDPAAHRIFPAKFTASKMAAAAIPLGPRTLIAKLGASTYAPMDQRSFRVQSSLDDAIAACALERFYADHQAYPATLAELVPAYLDRAPTDLIDGAPLRYARTADGRYRLYSVGWDGHDDGGQIALDKSGTKPDDAKGDWVWQYEPTQPPTSQRSK